MMQGDLKYQKRPIGQNILCQQDQLRDDRSSNQLNAEPNYRLVNTYKNVLLSLNQEPQEIHD